MMISDNAAVDEDELGILFTGSLHSREVMTPEVVMDVIDHLTDNYGADPDITDYVDSYQVWCVPMVNPDGVEIVFNEDQLWRKNARDNDDNGRVTWKDGVDINRNFEWGWGNQCQGSSDATSAATYRGPFEVSEPETRAVIELGRRVRPVFYVEYHSYGEDVFYAMGCDPDAFSPTLSTIADADQSISRVVGEAYASRIIQADGEPGFVPAPFGNRVDGIGRDHQAYENGAIAFVTELNSAGENGFRPFFNTWRQPTVEGQRPGWLWLLERIAGPAIGGTVKDALTGLPVAADVTLDQMSLPDGRRLTSREDTGRFHLVVVPGNYTLRLGAPGYQDVAVPLTVGATWQPLDVTMSPTGSTLLLRASFEDPTDAGAWTIGSAEDTATSGIWEWGEPLETHEGDVLSLDLEFGAPPLDRTPGQGSRAFRHRQHARGGDCRRRRGRRNDEPDFCAVRSRRLVRRRAASPPLAARRRVGSAGRIDPGGLERRRHQLVHPGDAERGLLQRCGGAGLGSARRATRRHASARTRRAVTVPRIRRRGGQHRGGGDR